ncbi:MAG: MBL fold metallo-hydrolase [Caldilineales bacterium]|nr:MBL fold metallo-hydrolase [Caldilineales bacterium]
MPRAIAPGIIQITLPTPFPVGDVHAYLLLGDPLTLVDTGVNWPPSRERLTVELAEAGVALADLEQIVITHSHLDHFGLARTCQAAGGATVLAHPAACAKLTDLQGYVQGAIRWSATVLVQAGLPAEKHGWVRAFYGIIPQMAEQVVVDRCINEGQTLYAGGSEWEVYFFPGHSGDLIGLYRVTDGLLLGSDHLLGHISSNALLEPPRADAACRRLPLIEYWRSLDRLESLAIRQVLPGHGAVITDVAGLLAERRRRRDRRLADIAGFVATTPRTVWEIAQALFPNMTEVDVFLAISEVIGHLDILKRDGVVREWREGELLRYVGNW